MRTIFLSLSAGAALLAGLATADAMPGGKLDAAASSGEITLVSGGCGLGFHRGAYGRCRPNFYRGYGYRGYPRRGNYYRNF